MSLQQIHSKRMHGAGGIQQQIQHNADPWATTGRGISWNSINLANCGIVKSVHSRGAWVVPRPTVSHKRNRWPRSLSSLCSDEWSAWVWAAWCRRNKPCWAPWAMNTHQHMECTSLSWTEYTCSPIRQMGLQQWKSCPSKPLVYFSLAG